MTSNDDSKKTSVLIIAAEASSTLYARRILEKWKSQGRNIDAFGVGDQSMIDLDFSAQGRAEEIAVVGIMEVISHWAKIKETFSSVLEEAEKRKPKFALLLDYPGFNLRLAKKLKSMNIPVVYYISPQIWAWRQGRVKTIKKLVDKVLTLFPFENRFYEEHDVPVEFVGHPLLDEIDLMNLGDEDKRKIREEHGLSTSDYVVGLMPGSRQSELKYHLKVQIETARLLVKKHAGIKVALLLAPGITEEDLLSHGYKKEEFITILRGEPFPMIHSCDAILCASGTATLMVGLMEKPMLIMYKMNSLTALIAKHLVGGSFGMVNLVLGEKGNVVPEFFQEQAEPNFLFKKLSRLVDNSDGFAEKMKEKLKKVSQKLGDKGATDRVVKALDSYF